MSSYFSMLSQIEERPCIEWRVQMGAGAEVRICHEGIVDVLKAWERT